MNTMYKQTSTVSAARRALTTKVILAFLGLALLAMSALAASTQPMLSHIGEEIPQVVPHRHEKLAGGVAGGVVWDHRSKERG